MFDFSHMILFFIIAFLFQLYVNLFVNIPLIQSFKELFSAFCGFRGANPAAAG